MKTPLDKRIELQNLLESILGMRHVYFQPPSNVKMQYPAIVYHLNDINKWKADNSTYGTNRSYKITLIDEDPDSEFVDKILELPMCTFNTAYISDNLNHFAFTIYY